MTGRAKVTTGGGIPYARKEYIVLIIVDSSAHYRLFFVARCAFVALVVCLVAFRENNRVQPSSVIHNTFPRCVVRSFA